MVHGGADVIMSDLMYTISNIIQHVHKDSCSCDLACLNQKCY